MIISFSNFEILKDETSLKITSIRIDLKILKSPPPVDKNLHQKTPMNKMHITENKRNAIAVQMNKYKLKDCFK